MICIVSLSPSPFIMMLIIAAAALLSKFAVIDRMAAVTEAEQRVSSLRSQLSAANEKLAAAGRKAELKISPAEGSFAGGLLLRRGSIETNCTAELLVELLRGDMSAELAGVLFD